MARDGSKKGRTRGQAKYEIRKRINSYSRHLGKKKNKKSVKNRSSVGEKKS